MLLFFNFCTKVNIINKSIFNLKNYEYFIYFFFMFKFSIFLSKNERDHLSPFKNGTAEIIRNCTIIRKNFLEYGNQYLL